MTIHFLLARRVPPVASPVLVETFLRLRARGWHVTSSIAEETVSRPDTVSPAHDLYVLKSHTELSLSLAGALHAAGASTLNSYPACLQVQNKIVASRVLRGAGVPVPDCWVTGDRDQLAELARERALIVKPYLGHRGAGIRIVRTPEEAARVELGETPAIVQEFVAGGGEDLKVYVVGDEVFAVRKAFSETSFTIPGRPCRVSRDVRRIALACGRAFGIGLYGLDVIESASGPVVVDVNTFPGYKGVPRIAPLIADYIADFATGRAELLAAAG